MAQRRHRRRHLRVTHSAGHKFFAFAAADNYLLFCLNTNNTFGAAWVTDGTTGGTFQINSPAGGFNGSTVVGGAAAAGHFAVFSGGAGVMLTDGTVAGTKPLTDATNNFSIGFPTLQPQIVGVGNAIYFLAASNQSTNNPYEALFKFAPTASGAPTTATRLATLKGTVGQGQFPTGLINIGGVLYFWDNYGPNATQHDLWRSDGTAAGTSVIATNVTGAGGALTPFGTTFYFLTNPGGNGAIYTWRSDGTAAGTAQISTGNTIPIETAGLAVDGTLFYANTDPTHGNELWAEPTLAPAVPQTPTNLAATLSGGVVTLTWGEPAGNTQSGVRLQRSTDPNFATTDENLLLPAVATQYADSVAGGTAAAYYYRIAAENVSGASAFSPVFAVPVPFTFTSQVNDGSAQRSVVKTVTLTFSLPVNLAAGAVTLSRLNTGGSGANDGSSPTDLSADVTWSNPSGDGTTWVVSFGAANAAADAFGSLTDGAYTLAVHAARVTGAGGRAFAADQTLTFHRLFGDIDGNGTVNNGDYLQFKKSYGLTSASTGYNANFDFDGNGAVNNADYLQFKKRFGLVFKY